MPDASYRHLKSAIQNEVLVLTILDAQLQDEQVAGALLQESLQVIQETGVKKVVFDFQKLKYMSSVAFRPFLSLRKSLNEGGGRLILCGLSSAVGDIFYTTKLVSQSGSMTAPFEMAPDVKTAVARLNNPGGSRAEI
jgi:anti-anti-sigma factor